MGADDGNRPFLEEKAEVWQMSMLTFDDCPPILKSCKDDDFSRRSNRRNRSGWRRASQQGGMSGHQQLVEEKNVGAFEGGPGVQSDRPNAPFHLDEVAHIVA